MLVYLGDRDLVAVLAEFWNCWRDEGVRIEAEVVEVGDVGGLLRVEGVKETVEKVGRVKGAVERMEEVLVGTVAARGRKRIVACALQLGV